MTQTPKHFLTGAGLLAVILMLGITPPPAQGKDWRQFRGPNNSGVADGADLPVQLDASKNVAWKIPLPGRGLSSPIIIGDLAIVTSSSGPKQTRLHVICYRTKDGSKVWERQFWATGRTMAHKKTCVAAPTPASDGTHIYALFSSNDLLCLDLKGNLVWMRGLTRDYPNASNSLGMSSSPIVVGDVLVVQIENDSESFAAGLDKKTGVNLWKLDRPKMANWTSPTTLTIPRSGKTVVALQSSHGIHAVDPKTGKEVLRYGEGASTIPSSTVSQDALFVPSNGLTVLKPTDDGKSFEEVWRSGRFRPGTASPVVIRDRVYVVNRAGILNCGDVKTGDRLWQLRCKGPFSATPVAAGKYLYLVNEAGLTQVVDTTAKEGEVVSKLELGETILSTPSISGNAIYLRSDGHLWKITKG